MTTAIKTQCPHCQACFDVQQTQLNKVNAIVNCEQCQQSFLVNKHLIVTHDTSLTNTQSKTKSPKHNIPSANRQRVKAFSSDDLIYDDMDIDETSETAVEYDSLDSMDAWLTQASHSSTPVNTPSNNTSKATNKESRASTKLLLNDDTSTSPSVLSSVAANDIHASVDQKTDNAWLEELLKEQNKREDTLQDDTDLSQLLLNMGVPLKNENNIPQKHIKKSQTKFLPISEKQSIAFLLWVLGCSVLALLLFAQYVIFNLENLVKNPVYADRLQTICSIAACSLPSADLNALSIVDVDHRSSLVNDAGTFSDVSATLKNQSAKAQLYPNLKVSIYSANNTIGEFIATPEEYLLSKQNYLAADSARQLLFTVPVTNTQIREITINPLY
ncbi:zinc-ribbon and DUF3426 domain-containing protein [Psychrobacter alimentarius]|uniref:zinc-ribbon and DUF3426 domain-containing protein n=1 Tax=Psychrobacter alimentarius TaxID=261164 RepID=UPI0019190E6E|nr:zinc-ribbon and DUF3426 domain-containing protein [Psychrobacter alimentarius]